MGLSPGTSVLIVEDVQAIRFHLRTMLQEMGFSRVQTAASVEEAQLVLTVEALADRLMEAEYQRVRNGEFSEGSLVIMRNRLDRHILPALGALRLGQVDRAAIERLMSRLRDEQASATTQSQYLVIVRKMLKLAVQEKWLDSAPDLPRIKVAHKPRSAPLCGSNMPPRRSRLRIRISFRPQRSVSTSRKMFLLVRQ